MRHIIESIFSALLLVCFGTILGNSVMASEGPNSAGTIVDNGGGGFSVVFPNQCRG